MQGRLIIILIIGFISGCNSGDPDKPGFKHDLPYYGADLSYVNEMEDCGAVYLDDAGMPADPFKIFADNGTNLVRLRLWHNPDWSGYSDYEDVKKSIQRSKQHGMEVLLDFHYSDTWADPSKQFVPAAWLDVVDDLDALSDSIYNYTYKVLDDLASENLLPEMVQVGNEINSEILLENEPSGAINWNRNAILLNRGIQAVRDISTAHSKSIDIMLHVAQPENGLWWFEEATANGITDYEWIGLSYYPKWSTYGLDTVSSAFRSLIRDYGKQLMVVETAYPFTMDNADPANNIMGNDALADGYPATQQGQLDFLNRLSEIIGLAGAEGIVYWEPAWVSTTCSTPWGQGSHWDNATLFDHSKKPTKGMQFYNAGLQE